MGQWLQVHWDLSEFVQEVLTIYPSIVNHIDPNYHVKEAIADMAAMALRDRSVGCDYNLEQLLRDGYSHDIAFLSMFFKTQSGRWYTEMLESISDYAGHYDLFTIEDILQLSPMMLLVKVWAEYHVWEKDLLA